MPRFGGATTANAAFTQFSNKKVVKVNAYHPVTPLDTALKDTRKSFYFQRYEF
jgi:hypothetical protein